MGEDNCSWKATCYDLPDENDLPSFKCVCNPGYNGNGTHCTGKLLFFVKNYFFLLNFLKFEKGLYNKNYAAKG